MTSRIRDLETELATSTYKDLEPVGKHLTDICRRFPDKQRTSGIFFDLVNYESNAPQPREFLQALNQLSSAFDCWMKENWKSELMGDKLRKVAKEIAQMSEDFLACCLMDKQFVS